MIEAVNPNVDHGGQREFVNGRTMALASGALNWIEAGWTERWNFADEQYAFGCGNLCYYDTGGQFPLISNGWYWFRAYQCGPPGQSLTCGDIYYNDQWNNLWTSTTTRCTNANGTGNCRGETRSEVLSEDSTPHPAFGGGAMDFAFGELETSNGWVSWTSGFPTEVDPTPPYIIGEWYTRYSDFYVCQTACQ